MNKVNKADELIVPIYINEKIVLDMLAILEDGFSTVSQVTYLDSADKNVQGQGSANIGTTATILSKLLKIEINGGISRINSEKTESNVSKEKIHTNVSLLSKFRSYLIKENLIKKKALIADVNIGDFIEVEGELQKNPLIDYLDIFLNIFRLANVFSDKEQTNVGGKKQATDKKKQDSILEKQIKDLTGELKHSGTIDFILSNDEYTAVLSAQEKYLENDNISEILGGRFKVLGKVIAICKDENENIDLLRKTTLSILPDNALDELVNAFAKENAEIYKLPQFVTKIYGPATILIPIAIYA